MIVMRWYVFNHSGWDQVGRVEGGTQPVSCNWTGSMTKVEGVWRRFHDECRDDERLD